MQAEVSLDFIKKLSPSEKSTFGDDRVGDMTGKPEFADAAVHGIILADVTTANSNLRKAVLDADGGNDAQKFALKSEERRWNKIMRKLAGYVTEKAQEKETLDEQIAVINVSGFKYNKIQRGRSNAPGQVTGFKAKPVYGVRGIAKISSDSAGRDTNYVSIFSKQEQALDNIQIRNNQIMIDQAANYVIHVTTKSSEMEITLSSGERWYGLRFAFNKRGRGPNSEKVSVVPQ